MDYGLEKDVCKPELLGKILQNNVLLCFVVLLLALKVASIFVVINFPKNIFFADITKIALENFANETRMAVGLQSLTESKKLNLAARMKAENMVVNNYFSHTSPTGISPWHWFSKAGYTYKYAGENLAIGFFESEEVFNAWLNSPSHKANILNPNYKEIGTAVLGGFGPNNSIVVVQEFGSISTQKQTAVKTQLPQKKFEPKPEAQPEVKQTEPLPVSGAREIVLSQAIEVESSQFLQNIILTTIFSVLGILTAILFFGINGEKFQKGLVFRSSIIVILLSLAALLNKDLVILLIPHQVII